MDDYWFSLRPDSQIVSTLFLKKTEIYLNEDMSGLKNQIDTDHFFAISKKDIFLGDPKYGTGGEQVYLYQIFKIDKE
jgi:hypothetical protein